MSVLKATVFGVFGKLDSIFLERSHFFMGFSTATFCFEGGVPVAGSKPLCIFCCFLCLFFEGEMLLWIEGYRHNFEETLFTVFANLEGTSHIFKHAICFMLLFFSMTCYCFLRVEIPSLAFSGWDSPWFETKIQASQAVHGPVPAGLRGLRDLPELQLGHAGAPALSLPLGSEEKCGGRRGGVFGFGFVGVAMSTRKRSHFFLFFGGPKSRNPLDPFMLK